jgi:hypothetical protein
VKDGKQRLACAIISALHIIFAGPAMLTLHVTTVSVIFAFTVITAIGDINICL